MSGDSKTWPRPYFSPHTFVRVHKRSQQDEGRRSHHEAIPAGKPGQASHLTAGRETDSSPSDQVYHRRGHTHHPTLLRRGAILIHSPDSSR